MPVHPTPCLRLQKSEVYLHKYSQLKSNDALPRTNVAIVAGGAAGGAVGLLVILFLAFCCFRLRRRQHLQALNERPSPLLLPEPEVRYTDIEPVIVDPFAVLSPNRLSGTAHPLQTWANSEAGSTRNFATWYPRSSSPIMNFSQGRVAPSSNISGTSSARGSISAAGVPVTPIDRNTPTPIQLHSPVRPAPVSYPSDKSRRRSGTPTRGLQQTRRGSLDVAGTRPNVVLTDEQADFVNGLFNNNVPAPVVACVLQRMLANPRGASSVSVNDADWRGHVDPGSLFPSSQTQPQRLAGCVSWLPTVSDHGDGETTACTAPPSYDHVQAQ